MKTSPSKILIVDDEPDLREIFREEFEAVGFEVTEAANGREGIKWIESIDFDVVLTDVRMPGGTGVELAESISKMKKAKPLIYMLSGYSEVDDPQSLNHVEKLFTKPFDLEVVVVTIVSAIKARSESK
jgi:DNA-binding response OmpR family regulator